MKILMVNKFLFPNGGSETYIFKLGEELTRLGHEVQFFGMEHEKRCVENRAQQYTANMDFHGSSKLKKLLYPFRIIYSTEARRKMDAVLRDFEPDVIHVNNFNYQLTPSILYAARDYKKRAGKKVRIVFTAHDYQLICPNHMLFDPNQKVCEDCVGGHFMSCTKKGCIHGSKAKSLFGTAEATLYRRLGTYRLFDAVICPSEFLKSRLDMHPALADKTVMMRNFTDTADTKETKKESYVLYFGRYAAEKGMETLLSAVNTPMLSAGNGEFEDAMSAAPHIKNLGFLQGEALEELINKASCSVYPSIWYENCPFSVMESIQHGTPVVGADIGGIPELVEDGKTGVLFESGNTAAFEKAVQTALEHADELSRNCLNTRFDTVQTYCEKLMNIYTAD